MQVKPVFSGIFLFQSGEAVWRCSIRIAYTRYGLGRADGTRVPKEQVIAGIIEDLEFAETHIPLKSKLPTDVGRLTKGAAQAMLARVALYIGTWNKFHGSGEYKSYLQIAKRSQASD